MSDRKIIEVDLTGSAPSRVQSAAFYAVKHLDPDETVVLYTRDDPSLTLRSIDLQLRHTLAWTVRAEPGRWVGEVWHRSETAPQDVLDLITRDHQRLDREIGKGMRLLNAGDATGAAPVLAGFATALRRHITLEDTLVVPQLGSAATGEAEPAAIMRREHDEILGQLAVLEECLAADPPSTAELSAFSAILSGTLAKHEYREEHNLFPLWRAALNALPPAARDDLLARATAVLGV